MAGIGSRLFGVECGEVRMDCECRVGPGRNEECPPEEPWVDLVRAELRSIQAPESLRARIAAMLAVERTLGS